MKTLALVLLLTLPMIGEAQEQSGTWRPFKEYGRFLTIDTTPRFVFGDRDSIVVIAAGDTVRTRGNAYLIGFQMLLLSKWDAYKAECYADSTVWIKANGVWGFLLKDVVDSLDIRANQLPRFLQVMREPPFKCKIRVRHREPTFPGFMEYLRSKD